jgi:antitoxin (DNA-binding transcriptional repressor) of toxin-antitoxin stability system
VHGATIVHMARVASRELRNHTADVLARAQAGEVIEVTVHGDVVAEVHPPRGTRPDFFTRVHLIDRIALAQADPGLGEVLAELATQSTADLGEPG